MKNNHKINYIFKALFFLNIIKLIVPQPLNRIIRIGEKDFRYSRISFNSKGDMIIDISSKSNTKERRFFGLKKNGNSYFEDQNNSSYFSLFIDRKEDRNGIHGRYRGESIFIKLGSNNIEKNGNEYLLGVTKYGNNYTELYFFNENIILFDLTSSIFGNITSNVFSIYKLPEDPNSNFHYIFSYIEDYSNFVIQTTYFNESAERYYDYSYRKTFECSNKKIVTCFYTVKFKYVCFYNNKNNYLTIIAFDKDFTIRNESSGVESQIIQTHDDESLFFKGIHLKEEIGAFIYFESSHTQNPTLILKQFDEGIKNYSSFGDIQVNKTNLVYNVNLNDIIKLNEFRICYVSTTNDKDKIKIIIFNLYDNDSQIAILYYSINIKKYNNISLYKELRLALYNNFIALTFSHYIYENNATNKEFYSSLVIFNYPNSTDNSLDLIEQLIITNKKIENDFCFNFKGKMEIENNIFDYEYKGTQIINFPDNIYLKINGKNVDRNYILGDKDCLTLSFPSNYSYLEAANYTIEYAYVLKEPHLLNMKPNKYFEGSIINNGSKYLFDYLMNSNNDYIGKSSNFNIIIKYSLTNNCQNYSCALCTDEENYMCVTCKYNFTFNSEKKKICIPNHTKSESEAEIPKCLTNEILDGNCSEKMTNEQIDEIYKILKMEISINENKIIETTNVIFQISSIKEQKNNNNPKISSIDLGLCEDIIKTKNGLTDDDELVMIKIDIKSDDLKSTYVQYEIYNPINNSLISLDVCGNIQIVISTPVKLIDKTEYLFNNLKDSGYNLFNISDKFYTDFCSTYTSENGTDLTLTDRKNIIYDNNANQPMCQEGCTFEDYNSTIQKAKCNCKVQTQETITDKNNIKFSKKLIVDSFSFYNDLIKSNFKLLKCYKLVFSLKGQKNNFGSYMMTIIIITFMILIIINIIKGNSRINYYIQIILKQKITQRVDIKRKSSFRQSNKEKINKLKEKDKDKSKNKDDLENKGNSENKRRVNKEKTGIFKYNNAENKRKEKSKLQNNNNDIKINKNNNFPPKRKNQKNLRDKGKRNTFKNSFENLSFSGKRMSLKPESMTNKGLRLSNTKDLLGIKRNKKKSYMKKQDKKVFNILKNIKEFSTKMISKKNPQNQYNALQNKKYNDEELNNLKYEEAKKIDKRTFFQYYYSLLKKKHLILFTFLPTDDYNLTTVKISLFLLSFSLYFTVNGFFFTDETMNQINKDKGEFNIIFQIPQILYSTIISSVINIILRYLSLSEKQMLSIKSQDDYRKAEIEAKNIKKCINIKLVLFFIISFLLMLFFWYYISSFCAVYQNTQIILIGDTLLSFGLSMIYPFGLNLLPATFRIIALRKKGKKCLYFISRCLAII